jgi:two-component system, chemotaxis family, CheB/CheR fusion protein
VAQANRGAGKPSPEKREIRRLEEELVAAKEYVRSALEDQETINEELRSANEEVLSSNEELQTANEELETAKEELQSANEELTTLNEELQNRNQELSQTANDLRNVLSSAYNGIVLVDRSLRIRFFTGEAESVLKLIPPSVGNLITNIKPALVVPDLGKLILEVIESAVTRELDVASSEGKWYTVRIRPYLTADNKVEGVVIVLRDVTESVHAQQALALSEERFRTLVEGVKDYAILMLDPEGKIVSANTGAERVLGYPPEDLVGKGLSAFLVGGHEEEARQELAIAVSKGRFESEASRVRKDGSQFWASVITIPLRDAGGNVTGFSTVVRDISERRITEDREIMMRLRAQDEERQRISHDLHDTAGPGLAALVMNLARVQKLGGDLNGRKRTALRESVALAKQCAQEIRTVSYELHPPLLDESGLEAALRWYTEGLSKLTGIETKLDFLPLGHGRLPKELEVGMFRIVQGALVNVQRHSRSRTASVSVSLDGDRLRLRVQDHGRGIAQGVREGLGIKSMRQRTLLLGGQFAINSDGNGTTVEAVLPAPSGGKSGAP